MSVDLPEPGRRNVKVELGERSYSIVIVSDDRGAFVDCLAEWCDSKSLESRNAVIISDTNVEQLHAVEIQSHLSAKGWRCNRIVLEPGEPTKSLQVVADTYDKMVALEADRHTIVIAVGGGVVGDCAGFVAATFARGIPFVQVPTTLLAQVDSSVGGKVGVNHAQAKNLIGAFYQPLGVFIDTSFLSTLPERDYRSGLAEVIKYGVILDATFFEYLEANVEGLVDRAPSVMRHIVAHSCQLKADVVQHDEFERTGLRAVLNYGHTFAHAYEALCGYGVLLHGEAVAIGMVHASRLAESLDLVEPHITDRQIALLKAVGLPTQLPDGSNLATDDILGRMKLDKKTVGGQLRFVLPTKLGHVETIRDVREEDVRSVLDRL